MKNIVNILNELSIWMMIVGLAFVMPVLLKMVGLV